MAVVSAVIAVYAAYWVRRSARGTFAHTAYELARTLHTDLTSGATARARDVLEHFRTAPATTSPAQTASRPPPGRKKSWRRTTHCCDASSAP